MDIQSGQFNPEISNVAQETGGNLANLVGFEIPAYNEINLTYISGGDADGEIHTVVYKSASVTVATLTLSYTGSDLTSIIKT